METRVRTPRPKAEDVPLRHMVGDGGEAGLEALRGGELEVLAAGTMGDRLGNVAAQTINRRNGGHLDQGQGRSELSQAVIELDGFVVGGVWVWIGISTHAAG